MVEGGHTNDAEGFLSWSVRDEHGRRAVFGDNQKLQTDPHFHDYPGFYEYFDGDTGRGVGASHQTGWTGLIATLLQPESVPILPSRERERALNSDTDVSK